MDDINKVLLNLYIDNLNFLEQNFPEIFKKIIMLEEAINNKQYQEKWSLEYIEDGDYFDILNLQTNEYLYNKNSFEHASNVNQEITLDNKSSFDMLNKKDGSFIESHKYESLIPLIKYLNTIIDNSEIEYEKLYKFIFFGTGLGLHINDVFEDKRPLNTLVIEPDLELFRISLFIINYAKFQFDDHKLFLSIGDDVNSRIEELSKFYRYHIYLNFNIKFYSFLNSYKFLIDDSLNYLSIESLKGGMLDLMVYGVKRTKRYLMKEYKFLDFNKFLLQETPAIILSGGPSLDKHLDWIKENQKYFVIVSINLMAAKLINYGIKPDIIAVTDPGKYVYETLKKIEDKEIYDNTICLCNSHVDPRAIDLFNKENVFLVQSVPFFKELPFPNMGNNVGMFALSSTINMNFKTIYTLGNDCAFDNETGNVYSSGSYFDTKIDKEKYTKDQSQVHHLDVVTTKGNFIDTVTTTRRLLSFKNSAESELKNMGNDILDKNLYNLSDGAYISGLTPLRISEINMPLKVKDPLLLKNTILKSAMEFQDITQRFKSDIGMLDFIKNKLLLDKKKEISSVEELLQIRLECYSYIYKIAKNFSSEMIESMFHELIHIFDNYINYYIALKGEKKVDEIKAIKDYWLSGFLYFIDDFKEILNEK